MVRRTLFVQRRRVWRAQIERVVFHDFPKGPHHGEIHRGTAIERARSDAIFYLCDDDLLLVRHVANLLELLAGADLVQCRNGYFDTQGSLQLFPTDLALPEAVAWHLREPPRNATSLTGTAHTRSAYNALPEGWTTTPEGQWPDHYMWKILQGGGLPGRHARGHDGHPVADLVRP